MSYWHKGVVYFNIDEMGNCCSGDRRGSDRIELTTTKGYGKSSKLLSKQLKTWKATGVVGLRDCKLKDLPDQIRDAKDVVRTIDASNNDLTIFPNLLADMTQLQRLILNNNLLREVSLARLTRLKVLSLNSNELVSLSEDIGECFALEKLSLCNNRLTQLPTSIGRCEKLKELSVGGNALTALPAALSACPALEIIDAGQNELASIPAEFGGLAKLKVLKLDGNTNLTEIPSTVLCSCGQLQTLSLHQTGVTREILEGIDGYAMFEHRRQAKYSKAIGGQALLATSGMDEGVDVDVYLQ